MHLVYTFKMRQVSLCTHLESDDEPIAERIERIRWDLNDIDKFYPIKFYPHRYGQLEDYLKQELSLLDKAPFERYSQNERVDYVLTKTYLEGKLRELEHEARKDEKVAAYLGGYFPLRLEGLLQARQRVDPVEGKATATVLVELVERITVVQNSIIKGQEKTDASTALRATRWLSELQSGLKEWFSFYKDYDPLFTWWVSESTPKLIEALQDLSDTIKRVALGISPTDTDTIIGEPVGRQGLLDALDSELIPYTPEELIEIGKKEYDWCEIEMQKAASDLGFPTWRSALENVKDDYVEPGKQTQLVRNLTREASSFVKMHDLITVPKVCENTSRTYMMSPSRQKMNPFFLGGEEIIVSYPTSTMSHDDKMMSMRGKQ